MISEYIPLMEIVLSGALGYIVWKLQRQDVTRSASASALMYLLRNLLRDMHKEIMDKGEATNEEYKEFFDVYKVYTELKGNSVATRWAEDVKKVKLTNES